MFKWEIPPEGGKEHTKFRKKAKAGKIDDLPQGTVETESKPFSIDLRPDGQLVKEERLKVNKNKAFSELLVRVTYPLPIIFEIERSIKRAIGKIGLYSFENLDNHVIESIYMIVKEGKRKKIINNSNKLKKLRNWLNKMEEIGRFKIRLFLIDLEANSMYELKNDGTLKEV